VELLTNQYGKNHPRIALALNNLAKVLRNKGRLAQAQAMYERALSILRKVHGDNHPHVATAMYNLGTLLALQGKNIEAISIMLTALERRRKVFGSDHVHVAESLKALGHLNYLEGNFPQAKEYIDECLAIRRKISEKSGDKNFIAISLNNKGLLLKSMLLYSEAEESLRESLSLRREMHESFNPSHPSIATGYNTLGTLLMSMRRQQEAREYLDKALRIRRDNHGSIHVSVANTLNSMAELSFGDGRYGEAASLLQQVVDMRSALYGESSAIVVANLSRLVTIHRTTGNETEATRVEAQLALIRNGAVTVGENAAILSMVMDAFEEDEDGATHVLKMDTGGGGNAAAKSVRVDNSIGAVVQGGPGWPDRLIAKLTIDQDALKTEIRDEEKSVADAKNSVDSYLRQTTDIKNSIEAKSLKIKDLENLVVSDKRYRYDLDQNLTERGLLIEQLRQLEGSEERDSADTLQVHENNLTKKDAQLKLLSIEIALVEDVRNRFKESEKCIAAIDEKSQTKNRAIEQIRWQLVQSDGSDETFITTLHANLRNAITEKSEIEIERELAEVVHRKILNELDVIRIRHGIASDMAVLARARAAQESRSGRSNMVFEDISDDDSDDSEDDDEGEEEEGEEDGGKTASLKKRVKKQRILINILTSQVESLGVVPIAEVVTFAKAEQRLQNSLVRLMEGDEEAAKDFDKWDQFVRNHPEFKAKEESKKLKWTRENTPINTAALRHIKSLVPPSIIVSYTLQMLEEALPSAIAKRVWSKKALWLTRISPSRISRLHIADLQTKYSTQGLDEIELRAVFAALPVTFENDGKGDKAAWRDSVLQSLQGKCKQELPWSAEIDASPDFVPLDKDVAAVIAATIRNPCYR
jgi:tetratricopeptide (TPR) repeat protein